MAVKPGFALSGVAQDPAMSIDPTRLIQGLVGGIGFLGAGAIMSGDSDGRLRGVASGTAIWAVGSIGVACGLGHLKEAAFVSVLIFAVLNVFERLELRGR